MLAEPQADRARLTGRRSRLTPLWAVTLFICFVAGVLLGVDYAGSALVPGATVLLVPAGVLLAVPAVVAGAHGARLPWQQAADRRGQLGALIVGLGFIGLGMLDVSAAPVWRALCLPGVLWIIGGLVVKIVYRPARSRLLAQARRRGGLAWMWMTYAGCGCFSCSPRSEWPGRSP